jgi:hypothetical protein
MTQPSPYFQSQSWDIITINGAPWGGPAGMGAAIEIDGASRFFKVDQKDGQGLDGATQTYRGTKPKPFKLIFSWWNDAQDAYYAFFVYPIVNYRASKPGMPPPVYAVSYPSLATLGISAILIEDIGAQKVDRDTKLSRAVWTVREFLPPPPVPATVTPLAAPPAISGAGGATAVSPYAAQNIADQNAIARDQMILNGGNPETFNGPI